MGENEVDQIEISKKTDLIPSHVSHILRGIQKTLAPEDLAKIAKVICRDEVQQAELLQSYLRDHLPEDFTGSRLIDIRIMKDGKEVKDSPRHYDIRFAPEIEDSLDQIRSCIPTDSNLRRIVLGLAKLVSVGKRKENS